MLLRLHHRTLYRYAGPSASCHNETRLCPLTDSTQTLIEFDLLTTPAAKIFQYEEPGGAVHHFGIRRPHMELQIVGQALVQTHVSNPFEGLDLVKFDWLGLGELSNAYAEYLAPTTYAPLVPEIYEWAKAVPKESSVATWLIAMCHHLHEELDYQAGATTVHTTAAEVLRDRAGVCQDFAHVFLSIARSQGIPSRYVSGYLYVEPADESMRGDHATHAWIDCLLPDGRWLSLDPTNNLLADDRYIRVHTGRDYTDVAPVRGVYDGYATTHLEVSVRVDREPEGQVQMQSQFNLQPAG